MVEPSLAAVLLLFLSSSTAFAQGPMTVTRDQFLANRDAGLFEGYPEPTAMLGEAIRAGTARPEGRVVVTHLGGTNALGLPLALVVSIALGAAIAVIVGLPAIRLRGVYLAIATFAFADAFDNYINTILLKVPQAKTVEKIVKLTPELMVQHNRALPGITAAFIVVKTNDEPGADFYAGVADPGELSFQRVAPGVLILLGLVERG